MGAASDRSSVQAGLVFVKGAAYAAALIIVLAVGLMILVPRLGGGQVFVVTSGSMVPTIAPGALVVDEPVSAADGLRVGEVVTFHRDGNSELVTHRITAIVNTAENGIEIHTKGDHNKVQDPGLVPAKAVVGKVVFAAPKVGYVVNAIATPWGAGIAAAMVAVALLAPSRKKKPVPTEDATS
jgi:signal peptidase